MKIYNWERDGLRFILEKSDEKPLWGSEGVSQVIKLYVENDIYKNIILSTSYGVDVVLETINRQKQNNNNIKYEFMDDYCYFGENIFYFILDVFQGDYMKLENDDCFDFYDWLIQSLSLMEGRKMKIGKIKQKIK